MKSGKMAYMRTTPLIIASLKGHLPVVQSLVEEFGADVDGALDDGSTSLYIACEFGQMDVVRCLVKEFGADVNKAKRDGRTPLMMASKLKDDSMVRFLTKYGANVQASSNHFGTAANVSEMFGAPLVQTEFLKAKTHCANPVCSGTGLKKCAGCEKVYFCGSECQVAHWPAHKAECKARKNA
jgi:ankyrin repeat protein